MRAIACCASAMALAAPAAADTVPFIDTTPGATTFTAPETGVYDILAFGAQGGASNGGAGGLGAEVGGDFTLTAGEILSIVVGGEGGLGFMGGGGGGGGGTFVQTSTGPLLIAGGGGGMDVGGPGLTSDAGGKSTDGIPGGSSGSGGDGGGVAAGGGSLNMSLANLIGFDGVQSGNGELDINLVPPAVPEPSTWAMLLLGFAGLGALAHRRNRSGSRPAKA